MDLKEGLTDEDKKILEEIKDKKIVLIYNKSDLVLPEQVEDMNCQSPVIPGEGEGSIQKVNSVKISSLTGEGIDELKDLIKKLFYSGSITNEEDIIITNERHRELLISAEQSVRNVFEGIEAGVSEDFLTIDMMDAYEALGKIVGESVEDDLADRIFRDFCMGK